ncbi:microfibril-associated glycoprotein 4-like [Sphaeramia orbicularis]|uniref:microfibril-associated glycoprotein 4-like n=1 Tax=Sphaeramia orbicularis TaxID=375764 RepID=UPI00117E8ACF|nr:microfibril-associated glycoprotein 4-like [Sphaeramia orbicularis]
MIKETLTLVVLVALAALVHSDSQFYLPIDCDDIFRHDNRSSSGIYTIYPGGPTTPLKVYCDMNTDGGRWTVFLRRLDGSENFFRPWNNYKSGFGNVAGEYWLGLENIFLLSMRKKNEMRVDMEDWSGTTASANYDSFSIDSELSGYQLHLGSFTGGSAGDGLTSAKDMKFTTYDKDQDTWDYNCAQHFIGGFWYGSCHGANPTGMYAPNGALPFDNVQALWSTFKAPNYSLKRINMKIRSISKCYCN